MNYVYDILLNFQDYAYDFYDGISMMRLHTLERHQWYEFSTEQLEKLNHYRCQIAPSFVKKIENQAEHLPIAV